MGAVVITLDTDPTFSPGGSYMTVGTLHLSTSYANPGGDTFIVSQFGFGTILTGIVLTPDPVGDFPAYPVLGVDRTNLKILAYGAAGSAPGLTEITNTTDLHTYNFRFQAWGV